MYPLTLLSSFFRRCASSVGRLGGAQKVSLGPGCLYAGIVMHEFMHVAGFWHEQSRNDRDNHITINRLNVQDGMWYNFEKYSWGKIQSLGLQYDLGRCMCYVPAASMIPYTFFQTTLAAVPGSSKVVKQQC